MIFLKSIKIMKKIRYLFLFLFLISCAAAEDAKKVFKNEKVKTTDEFLVKQKEPLILPPDYNKIPVPGSLSKDGNSKDGNNIKKILKNSQSKTPNNNNSSSVEDSIIDKIR